jgi:hypothetical protein
MGATATNEGKTPLTSPAKTPHGTLATPGQQAGVDAAAAAFGGGTPVDTAGDGVKASGLQQRRRQQQQQLEAVGAVGEGGMGGAGVGVGVSKQQQPGMLLGDLHLVRHSLQHRANRLK